MPAKPPKRKSRASCWGKGTKDQRRQRDHQMRQNAASTKAEDPPPADTSEIDDAAAKLQTFTPRDSPVYDVSQGIKLAIVFNNRKFKDNRMKERNGTEKDVQAISQTFAELSFEIEVLENPTYTEICQKLKSIQKLKNLSCLALFILTHGEENGVLASYDGTYTLNKHIVTELLPEKCPSLAGKPKLIFIQACQGRNKDEGVMLVPRVVDEEDANQIHRVIETEGLPENIPYCIPNHGDFLIFSAAYQGYVSFRHPETGSWFMQALCDQINDSKPDEDLNSILTKVSFYVAITKPSMDQKKQVPMKQDTLLRKIYLKSRPDAAQQRSTNNVTNNGTGNDEIFTAQTDDLGSRKQRNFDKCNCM